MIDAALPPECPRCGFFVTYPTIRLSDTADIWVCIRCYDEFPMTHEQLVDQRGRQVDDDDTEDDEWEPLPH